MGVCFDERFKMEVKSNAQPAEDIGNVFSKGIWVHGPIASRRAKPARRYF